MVVDYVIRKELVKVSKDKKIFTEKVFKAMGIVEITDITIPRNMIVALLNGWLYIGKVTQDTSGQTVLSVAKCRTDYTHLWNRITSWEYPGECLKHPKKNTPKGELADFQTIIELKVLHGGIYNIKTIAYGAFSIKFIPICHEIVETFLNFLKENSEGDGWEPRFETDKIIKYVLVDTPGVSHSDNEKRAQKYLSDLPKDEKGNLHPFIDPDGVMVESERAILKFDRGSEVYMSVKCGDEINL